MALNREQKAMLVVSAALGLVILVLVAGTLHLSRQSRLPMAVTLPRQADDTPEKEVTLGEFTAVDLHFFDPQQDALALVRSSLSLARRPDNLPRLIRLAFESLQSPPPRAGILPAIPEGSLLEAVFVDPASRTAYLSLNEKWFRNHPGGAIEGWAAIYSIVNTVCSLSANIESVVFLKQGRSFRQGPGGWDFSRPFRPDDSRTRQMELPEGMET
jgi:hypothetical protein